MNSSFLLNVFAWIAIIALSISILSDFWLPMVVGAVLASVLVKYASNSRY